MDPFYDLDLQDDIDDYYVTPSLGGGVTLFPPAAALGGSAFAAYQQGRAAAMEQPMMTTSRGGGGAHNARRRMFGYLRRIGDAAAGNNNGPEPADGNSVMMAQQQAPPRGSSRFRHIMRERVRRERLSQGFADLHALLPHGASKGGKNDIVGAAAGYIVELQGRRQWLRARNEELRLEQAARSRGGMVVKVRAVSERHSSVAVDVFETVLRRLKAMEALRVTGIRSCFGDDGGMWMDVGVECEVSASDVDKAVTNALTELMQMQVPRSSRQQTAFSCQVGRGVPMC
ncbi:hypothetical protein PR202_ga09477 [Eleusine coracana subsp. coracana]|uniref:BHLH domain-containing protein n=1 Tax=Eleusine coracana subsp. coracana TaxID=191504 RepID=A0AAV5C2X7_ELECO|nr:hypothetical protein QOZ80_1AG0035290 [Eleusine coracana subsp. coracana]GJM92968.1 hypothetical protein PR202_ga09477 [Eleusine coracana subsp. coracana]